MAATRSPGSSRDKDRERFVVDVPRQVRQLRHGRLLPGELDAGDTLVVEDFMLSCRVQGKFVEQALFWCLAEGPGGRSARVVVNFKRTDRNAPRTRC